MTTCLPCITCPHKEGVPIPVLSLDIAWHLDMREYAEMVPLFNAVLAALNLESALTQVWLGVAYLVYKRYTDNLHCEALQQRIILSTLTLQVQGHGIL